MMLVPFPMLIFLSGASWCFEDLLGGLWLWTAPPGSGAAPCDPRSLVTVSVTFITNVAGVPLAAARLQRGSVSAALLTWGR